MTFTSSPFLMSSSVFFLMSGTVGGTTALVNAGSMRKAGFSQKWFETLFGFAESDDRAATIANLECSGQAGTLTSNINGAQFGIGTFSTPSLGQLRAQASEALDSVPTSCRVRAKPMRVSHAAGRDVSALQAKSPTAVFQVASQFNCLEFTHPTVAPEAGVTFYCNDKTQGPAACISCGPAAVYRNYFAPVQQNKGEQSDKQAVAGQSRDRQIDNLRDVCKLLGNRSDTDGMAGRYYSIHGGYVLAGDKGLHELNDILQDMDSQAVQSLKSSLRVGLHQGVQVTSSAWGYFQYRDRALTIDQVLTSAVSVSDSANDASLWEPFARIILEAAYEAVLWAAVLNASRNRDHPNANVVFLTYLGAGVFGNPVEWVVEAMALACGKFAHIGLDIRIVTYKGEPPTVVEDLVKIYSTNDAHVTQETELRRNRSSLKRRRSENT